MTEQERADEAFEKAHGQLFCEANPAPDMFIGGVWEKAAAESKKFYRQYFDAALAHADARLKERTLGEGWVTADGKGGTECHVVHNKASVEMYIRDVARFDSVKLTPVPVLIVRAKEEDDDGST